MLNNQFVELKESELQCTNGGGVLSDIGNALKEGFTEFGKTLVSEDFRKPFTSVMKITGSACSLIANPLGVERAAYTIQNEWDKLASYGTN